MHIPSLDCAVSTPCLSLKLVSLYSQPGNITGKGLPFGGSELVLGVTCLQTHSCGVGVPWVQWQEGADVQCNWLHAVHGERSCTSPRMDSQSHGIRIILSIFSKWINVAPN